MPLFSMENFVHLSLSDSLSPLKQTDNELVCLDWQNLVWVRVLFQVLQIIFLHTSKYNLYFVLQLCSCKKDHIRASQSNRSNVFTTLVLFKTNGLPIRNTPWRTAHTVLILFSKLIKRTFSDYIWTILYATVDTSIPSLMHIVDIVVQRLRLGTVRMEWDTKHLPQSKECYQDSTSLISSSTL